MSWLYKYVTGKHKNNQKYEDEDEELEKYRQAVKRYYESRS